MRYRKYLCNVTKEKTDKKNYRKMEMNRQTKICIKIQNKNMFFVKTVSKILIENLSYSKIKRIEI